VCISNFVVDVRFGSATLSIECTFSHLLPGSIDPLNFRRRDLASNNALHLLLGKRVSGIERKSNQTLVVAFNDGQVLTLVDDSQKYDSFQALGSNRASVIV